MTSSARRLLKWTIAVAAFVLVAALWRSGVLHQLSLTELKQTQAAWTAWAYANPWQAAAGFLAVYIVIAGASLPGAAILTLAAGALFGLVEGVVLSSFGSTIGATLAFLASRFLFRDRLLARNGDRLKNFNTGIRRDGGFYLFTLRLVTVVPFFIVNVLAGLTSLSTRTFYFVSQVGMLPGTIAYVFAGTQLARIDSLSSILSPGLLAAFALLGILPLLLRKLTQWTAARRIYRPFRKPRRFDYNLIVIGAGSAGLVSAYIGSTVRARVALIEKDRMGGDCLNTGCVPSNTLAISRISSETTCEAKHRTYRRSPVPSSPFARTTLKPFLYTKFRKATQDTTREPS